MSAAAELWVPASNNWGGLGRWAFLEVSDMESAADLIYSRFLDRPADPWLVSVHRPYGRGTTMAVARRAPRKNDRLELRVEPERRELLDAAAAASGMSTSAFVLSHATEAAREVLAVQTTFILPKERWDEFVRLLNRPARAVPDLAAFVARPSVFDDPS